MSLRQSMLFIGNADSHTRTVVMPAMLLIVLFFGLAPLQGFAQTQACATGIQVTFVSASPRSVTVGTTLTVDFQVVTYSLEEYLGCVSNPVTGLQTGSFILSPEGAPLASMLGALQSSQATEHNDVPLSPGAKLGEYLAEFQVTQNDPTGNVLVYVKAESLQTTIKGTVHIGPATNVSSVQTEDTSDFSAVDVRVKEQPSVWAQLMQSNVLPLLILAALIILIILISVLARRKRKPSSKQ